MIDSAMSFFQNGAGNVLNSTVSAISSIVSGVTTFVIAFVFSCYILLQKEKLSVQVQKVMHAYLSEKHVEWCMEVCSLTFRSFSSFLTGQCVEALILGTMFFIVMSIFNMPYAMLVGVLIAFTALIPIFGAFIGCVIGAFLILMVDSASGAGLHYYVSCSSADRGEPDLSEGGGKFGRTSVHMGAGGALPSAAVSWELWECSYLFRSYQCFITCSVQVSTRGCVKNARFSERPR